MRILLRKLVFVSIVFFVSSQALIAQPPSFAWVKTAGSNTNTFETAADMLFDADNSVVTAGTFYSTVDFDPGTGVFNLSSNGASDVVIVKYTRNGHFMWAKSIGGTFDDFVEVIKRDNQGNMYLLGRFQSTVDFDPGPAVFNQTNTGGTNTYILKLDKDGNFLWVKIFRGISNTFDIDNNGNLLIGGYFGGTVDFDPGPGVQEMTASAGVLDMFLLKLDPAANFIWARQIRNLTNSNHQQGGLETDASGNVFFSGNFTNSLDFDPGPATVALTSTGAEDIFILKLNAQGDYQWVKQIGAAGFDKAMGMDIDGLGSVITTGRFYNTVDFDPGSGNFPLTAPTTAGCAFISKLDNAGNFVYAKNFQSGETDGLCLTTDAVNNVYLMGSLNGTVDFDPGPGIYNITGPGGYTAKLDQNGAFVWAAGYLPTTSNSVGSIYASVKVDPLNNVYTASAFIGTVDFDPGPGSFISTSNGLWDMFTVKLGTAPCNNPSTSIINAQACGSYTFNAVTYTSSGQYYQLLTNTTGCDSIVRLNLLLTNKETGISQTSCGPLLWNGKLLTSSGVYRDTTKLPNNCDSITVLSLTVNPKPIPNLGIDTAICNGDTIRLTPGNFTAYQWSTGSTNAFITVTQPGVYWVNVTDANNCTARDTVRIQASGTCITCTDSRLVENIYPVPARSKLIVKLSSSACQPQLDLYNALGQLLIKGYRLQPGINTVNIEWLPAAPYFYRIYFQEKILREGKLLKL